jgi:hypothetical protein
MEGRKEIRQKLEENTRFREENFRISFYEYGEEMDLI